MSEDAFSLQSLIASLGKQYADEPGSVVKGTIGQEIVRQYLPESEHPFERCMDCKRVFESGTGAYLSKQRVCRGCYEEKTRTELSRGPLTEAELLQKSERRHSRLHA